MKFYNLLIKYRLWIGIGLGLLGGYVNYAAGFWPAFPALFCRPDPHSRPLFSLAPCASSRNTWKMATWMVLKK